MKPDFTPTPSELVNHVKSAVKRQEHPCLDIVILSPLLFRLYCLTPIFDYMYLDRIKFYFDNKTCAIFFENI
jgi:hypothetical protein